MPRPRLLTLALASGLAAASLAWLATAAADDGLKLEAAGVAVTVGLDRDAGLMVRLTSAGDAAIDRRPAPRLVASADNRQAPPRTSTRIDLAPR